MDSFLHLCSIKLALKFRLKMKLPFFLERSSFRDYYNSLTDEQKEALRTKVLNESGMAYSTFYYKLRTDSFKPLEIELVRRVISTI